MLSALTVRPVWQPFALALAIGGAIASTGVTPPALAQSAIGAPPLATATPEPTPTDAAVARGRSPSPWLWPELFLPDFPSFDSQRLDEQLALYSLYLATVGTPDVLIVGSSRSLQGIDPMTLQQALAEQGYPGLKIYNFGVNGATAQVIDLVVRQVLTPDQLPKLIIWADGSRAFNSGRDDATYAQIAASPGYQRLQGGHHPITRPTHPLAAPLREICLTPPPAAYRSPGSLESQPWVMAIAEVLKLPTLGLQLTSHLFWGQLQHTVPCAPALSSQASSPTPGEAQPQISQSPAAATAGSTALAAVRGRIAPDLSRLGFLAVGDRFDPNRYYQTRPMVPGQYDGAYVPFQLEGAQTTAALRLAAYAQQQQIPLVFVNLPLTTSYLDAFRQRYEQQFQRHMQSLAAQGGFLFIDLSQAGLNIDAYFADPSHLNQAGARAIAQHLATVTQIPWQTR